MILPLLRLLPWWAWPLAGLLLWGGWQQHRASRAHAAAAAAQAEAAAEQASRQALQRITAAHHQVEIHARTRTQAARADARRADAAGHGLRIAATAAAASAASSAPAECADTAEPARVLADVLGQVERAGRAVAAHADDLATALDACQRAYSALTAEPPR